ncbi:patatin-like phospholipase family protein [Kordiimonas marina]|uniref:patatin-like phospholipase family protein n=1 Tax=Kordiimonas marina TaxID=2872312 RepID=UPI001FF3A665|nr:patatin-like phospholipase family protein [Kordiimonas marina]MCJ9428990.1 patatin-like phospholipase family protein [Kordiimonas marina]
MTRIGLALGGGAGLGWAHIGVVRVLEAEGIEVDMVAGTSIGSIVGACVAADLLDELEDIAREIKLKDMLALGELGIGKGGLIGGGKIERRLREHFGARTIEQLPKPFAAVAADIYSGARIVLDEGDVVTAVRASSAVPGMLPPVRTGRLLLTDGGVVDPVPVAAVRDLGADFIIAVDLQGDYEGRARRMGFDPAGGRGQIGSIRMARAGWSLALQALSRARLEADRPDITITPLIGHIDMADFTKAHELIEHGKKAGLDALPLILSGLDEGVRASG